LRWTVVFVLVAAAAGLFLVLRMYRTDIKELKRFVAAYDRFDTAMAEDALRAGSDEAGDVRRALAELQAYAGMRLSSLIKNDGELMAQAREVGDLARQEYEARNKQAEEGKASLGANRKAAFARFMRFTAKGTEAKKNEGDGSL